MSTHPFQYVPLDRGRSEIRLLTLQNNRIESQPKYSLSKVSLKDTLHFNALSYTWGSAGEKRSIIINDEAIEVTANLESALRHLHCYGGGIAEAPLWVDAICINQLDIHERNHQVQMMKQIYKGASRVLIWLGKGDSYCDWAFERVNNEAFLEKAGKAESEFYIPDDELLKFTAVLDRNILRREWWHRMWVVQEVVLAKQDPFIMCGRSFTTWRNFVKAHIGLKYIMNSPTYQRAPLNNIPRYSTTEEVHAVPEFWNRMREDYEKLGSLDLSILFAMSRFCKATNPRDYVYGCLGFLKPEFVDEIVVDYGRHPIEVYKDTVLTMIRRDATSYFRNCIILFPAHAADPQYPSWVPFLAHKSPTREWQHSSQGLVVAKMATLRTPQVFISKNCDMLRVAGIKLDEVLETHSFDQIDCFDGRKLNPSKIQHSECLTTEARKTPLPVSHTLYQLSWLRMYEDILSIFIKYYCFEALTADDRGILWDVLSGQKNESGILESFSNEADRIRWKRLFDILFDAAARRVGGRKFLVSKSGFVGIGVPKIEKGDIIVYIFGMHFPLIVRAKEDRNGYVMIGFAYISGLMDIDLMKEFDGKRVFNHLETTLDIY